MAKLEISICPDCGLGNPPGTRTCGCGHNFPALPTADEKPKQNLWIATLPAIIVLTVVSGVVVRNFIQFRKVAAVVSSNSAPSAANRNCVETYGITLHTSEFYVSELGAPGPLRRKDAPPELSTVIRGTARNACGVPLKSVRIKINVRDDGGRRGSAWADVGAMAVGQIAAFERAWMGRVTSYEIVEVR